MRKPKPRRVKRPPTQLDFLMVNLLQVNRKLHHAKRRAPRHTTGHLVSYQASFAHNCVIRLERQQKHLIIEVCAERSSRGLGLMSPHRLQSYGLTSHTSVHRSFPPPTTVTFDSILSTPRRGMCSLVLTNPDRFAYRNRLMDPLVFQSLSLITPRSVRPRQLGV